MLVDVFDDDHRPLSRPFDGPFVFMETARIAPGCFGLGTDGSAIADRGDLADAPRPTSQATNPDAIGKAIRNNFV